ncbi:MAG: NAD(P)-dependent oxidoreductase [Acidobacteriota bacterium]
MSDVPDAPSALVTGGAGFLGSHIADTLSERGFAVTLFDRQPSPYRRPDQQMVEGDILDADALMAAAEGCDVVYHLAALADLNEARSRPHDAAKLNILGTLHALEAARAHRARRFVFASTVYVYSRAGGFYRCSKQSCEAFIEEFQRQSGLAYTILRYGSLYGPRADASNGFYHLLRQARQEGRIVHSGRPDDRRDYIHVGDAARLSVDALDPAHENQHLVLTGPTSTRLEDLFTMFEEILGRRIEVDYRAAEGDGHYRVTPYAYSPRTGHKLTSNLSVDMGQGILQLLEQLDGENPENQPAEPTS